MSVPHYDCLNKYDILHPKNCHFAVERSILNIKIQFSQYPAYGIGLTYGCWTGGMGSLDSRLLTD